MAEWNDKEIMMLVIGFIISMILDIVFDFNIVIKIIIILIFCGSICVYIYYKYVIKDDFKSIIRLLEKYEEIRCDEEKEMDYTRRLGLLFPSLVEKKFKFTFTSDDRPDSIKNERYNISWSPIGKNPTTYFFIRRMENRMKAIKPEEAYYSQDYINRNSELHNETAVEVLNDFINFLKEKKSINKV